MSEKCAQPLIVALLVGSMAIGALLALRLSQELSGAILEALR